MLFKQGMRHLYLQENDYLLAGACWMAMLDDNDTNIAIKSQMKVSLKATKNKFCIT
jgi:hypothetical protein